MKDAGRGGEIASGEVDSTLFRKSVGLFATGVAVVTATDGEEGVHGVTVNSFTSISLAPPTVMVSLKPGRAHDLISEHGYYGVSVLNQEQRHCSQYFSGHREPGSEPEFVVGDHVHTLRDSLVRLECAVVKQVTVEDHTLFIGRVVSCESSSGPPLMFFASSYHEVAC